MTFLEGARIYIPGFGPAVIKAVTKSEDGTSKVHVRVLHTNEDLFVADVVLTLLRSRPLVSRSRAIALLERRSLPSGKRVSDRIVFATRPEQLFDALFVSALAETRDEIQTPSPDVMAVARTLLVAELTAVLDQHPQDVDRRLSDSLTEQRITAALERLHYSDVLTKAAGLTRANVPTFIERRPAETIGFFRESRLVRPGQVVTESIPHDDADVALELMFENVQMRRVEPVLKPIGLSIAVFSDDLDRHADVLSRAEVDLSRHGSIEAVYSLRLLALYPSGAVRSVPVTSHVDDSETFSNPFVFLDPDSDPPRGADGGWVHSVILAGF